MNYLRIETTIASHFGFRQNIIVPNVSWSLFPRQEVDLLVIRPSGFAIEVEIKTSKSDIKADLSKQHTHWNRLIKQTWFGVPEMMEACEYIPDYAGVLSVRKWTNDNGCLRYYVKVLRSAKNNPNAVKLNAEQINTVLHCGCMRIWSLKEYNLAKLERGEK